MKTKQFIAVLFLIFLPSQLFADCGVVRYLITGKINAKNKSSLTALHGAKISFIVDDYNEMNAYGDTPESCCTNQKGEYQGQFDYYLQEVSRSEKRPDGSQVFVSTVGCTGKPQIIKLRIAREGFITKSVKFEIKSLLINSLEDGFLIEIPDIEIEPKL